MRIIIQASLQSRRYPRKVLADLDGEPMLKRLLDRLDTWNKGQQEVRLSDSRNSPLSISAPPHELHVSIPTEKADDELSVLVDTWGYHVVRKVKKEQTYDFAPLVSDLGPNDWFVRLTADNPLFDPTLIERLIARRRMTSAYTQRPIVTRHDRYANDRSFPGMDAELIPVLHVRGNGTLFNMYHDWNCETLSTTPHISGLSLTVDYPKDMEVIRECYAAVGEPCRYEDIIKWWNKKGSASAAA